MHVSIFLCIMFLSSLTIFDNTITAVPPVLLRHPRHLCVLRLWAAPVAAPTFRWGICLLRPVHAHRGQWDDGTNYICCSVLFGVDLGTGLLERGGCIALRKFLYSVSSFLACSIMLLLASLFFIVLNCDSHLYRTWSWPGSLCIV